MKPVIFGLSGPVLTPDERAFFAEARPAGYILFKRNVVDCAQLRALTDSLRDLEGRSDVAILVDQEGGRVARLGPPEWPAFPAGPAFDALYEKAPISAIEAARANATALCRCSTLLAPRLPRQSPVVPMAASPSASLRWAARRWKGWRPAASSAW